MTHLHIDFETRSTVELKTAGADVYARHPTTDPWCLGWALGDDDVKLWKREDGELPNAVRSHVCHGGIVLAHNAPFELAIWNNVMTTRYDWPTLDPEQVRCTMAMSYAMGLPGALEEVAAAVGLNMQKDAVGHRIMLQLAKPRKVEPDGTIVWWDNQEKLDRLYEYCKQDVRTERELAKRVLPLSDKEQRVWQLDYRINQRGIAVDVPTAIRALEVVEAEGRRLNEKMREVTNGAVSTCNAVGQLGDWIRTQGVEMDGVAKADVIDALAEEDLPESVRKALVIRQEAGKASTAKLKAMIRGACEDGRMRSLFQYHGASTGRWAGRRVQKHNLPRPKIKQAEIEDMFDLLGKDDLTAFDKADWIFLLHGNPLQILSDCIRGFFTSAPGKDLIAGDFVNIEGRCLAWEAGENWKLRAFQDFDKGVGPDIYKLTYARSFGVPVEDVSSEHRQIGKVEELALGYQGGVGAFQSMAKAYNLIVSDERADEIKVAWRNQHPAVVRYWYALEEAALNAVRNPGLQTYAGPDDHRQIAFKKKGSFLWLRLPSGRALCYPYPRIEEIDTPWGDLKDAVTYMTVIDPTKKSKVISDPYAHRSWQRVSTYGGKLAENVTQAIARDLLAEALLRLDEQGLPIVSHVHDEVVGEVRDGLPSSVEQAMWRIMAEPPEWAAGLPVAVEGWRGKRYRK